MSVVAFSKLLVQMYNALSVQDFVKLCIQV